MFAAIDGGYSLTRADTADVITSWEYFSHPLPEVLCGPLSDVGREEDDTLKTSLFDFIARRYIPTTMSLAVSSLNPAI